MAYQQTLGLEELLSPRIFIDNDAIAFFDVEFSWLERHVMPRITDVAKIEGKPMKPRYEEGTCPKCDPLGSAQLYNFLVKKKKIHYFRTDNYDGDVRTVSITDPCIVFCGYTTNENVEVKSSGVYHAFSMPPDRYFEKRLYKLIDTIRTAPDEEVIIKAAGGYGSNGYLQKIRNDLTEILAGKGIKIKQEYILLGGDTVSRVTEFDPKTGQLITYFYNSEQKTIL